MSGIDDVSIALRVFGDDLDPPDVTVLLDIEPTSTYRKGDVYRGKKTGFTRVEKTGAWILDRDYKQRDLECSVKALLHDLPDDLSIWKTLNDRYSVDLYLGLWMKASNEGFELGVETSRMLADRGLRIGFDIYCPLSDRVSEHEDGAEQ